VTVESVELFRVRMPLRHPHRAAHGTEDERASILVHVVWNGSDGWGECPALARPTYTAEYHDGAWAVLRDHLVPELLARSALFAGGTVGHPMARGALSDAIWDAQLRGGDESLLGYLGLDAVPVPTTTVVSLADSVDTVLAAVTAAPGPVKVKVEPGHDVEPLRAIRDAFPDRSLAADANASYQPDRESHVRALEALDELGLRYLEQPHPGIVANGQLATRLRTPICLDEPIDSVDAASLALSVGALAVLNVKPARVGGVGAAVELVRWALTHEVDAFIGGMIETGVGRASAAALALLPGCTLPTDLGPSARYWDRDVTPAIIADAAGCLVLPTGPGLGSPPEPDRLAEVTVERLTFRR